MRSVYAEVFHLIEDKPDYKCPVCGAVNPAQGFYRQGFLIGCDECITVKDADFVPEFDNAESA